MTEDKLNNLFQQIRDREPEIPVNEVELWVAATAITRSENRFSKFKSSLFTKNIVITAISIFSVLGVSLFLLITPTSITDKKQLNNINSDNQKKTEYPILINNLNDTIPVKKNKTISGNVKRNDTIKYVQPSKKGGDKSPNKTLKNEVYSNARDSTKSININWKGNMHTLASRTLKHVLKKIGSIDLPSGAGKCFGYLTIDYKHNYLLVAQTDADVLYVIDLKTNKLVKKIEDTPGATDVEYVPELNKIYTSNSRDCTVGVIDMNTFEVIKKIPTTWKAHGITYAPDFKKLYVSDKYSKTLLVIDVVKDEVIKKITFNSKTGMPQYDPVAKKIYLNLPDKNKLAVIDPVKDTLIAQYNVSENDYDCSHNNSIELDIKNRRILLGCENGTITFLNFGTYKEHTSLGTAGGIDAIKYDPGIKRIYVACSSGAISVIDAFLPIQLEDFPAPKKTHSLAVDINTHRVYVPVEEENGKAVSKIFIYDAVP
jgi:YVTN family beta-propeller protein